MPQVERRALPRYDIAWPVSLWIADQSVLPGRAVNASRHAALISLGDQIRPDILKPGRICVLDIHGPKGELTYSVRVRRATKFAVVVETDRVLPVG